jgi:arylformamidase
MKIIDISWPIVSGATTEYKDRATIYFEMAKNFPQDQVRDSLIRLSSHSGTHVDAPSHFLEDGKTIDQVSLHSLIGRCKVFDLSDAVDSVKASDLQDYDIQEGDIVLLKTTNSLRMPTEKFDPHFIYVNITAAELLARKKVKAVGIDYLGIERSHPDHPTHITLMKHNITIIEGLRLSGVQSGEYTLCCLPLNIIGLEAAPARAVLISFE